ncbi:hypothetical protein J6590_038637 [Homalodisca vitripennis]|nr:hypothetical protein J6590_038637 [Homalodisca vitripennis]
MSGVNLSLNQAKLSLSAAWLTWLPNSTPVYNVCSLRKDICYTQTPNSDNVRNFYSLRDVDNVNYPRRGLSIFFGHWPKRNTQNALWVSESTQETK